MMVCTDIIDKERLYQYRNRLRAIKSLENLILYYEVKQGPKSPTLSDMPKSQMISDKTSLSDKKVEIEKRKAKLVEINLVEKAKIESIFEKMLALPDDLRGPTNIEYCYIIKFFYLEGDSWRTIADKFFPDDEFSYNGDSNEDKVKKWHGKALTKFLECQEK